MAVTLAGGNFWNGTTGTTTQEKQEVAENQLALGTVMEKYEYDVYGKVIIRDRNGTVLSQSAIKNPIMFQGQRYDEETGLYYFKSRYYDPEHGRFITRDPAGEGINLYAFVNNNPINFVDPFGLYVQLTDDEYAYYRGGGSTRGEQVCAALMQAFGGYFWFEGNTLTGHSWNPRWADYLKQLLWTDENNMSLSSLMWLARIVQKEKDMPHEGFLGLGLTTALASAPTGFLCRGLTTARASAPTIFLLKGGVNESLTADIVKSETVKESVDIVNKSVSKSEAMNMLTLMQPTDICIIAGHGALGSTSIQIGNKSLQSDELAEALSCGKPGIVFLHGCATSQDPDDLMAGALKGGAKVVLGFSKEMSGMSAAHARDIFLKAYLKEGKTLAEAVGEANDYLWSIRGSVWNRQQGSMEFQCNPNDPSVSGMTWEQYKEHCANITQP